MTSGIQEEFQRVRQAVLDIGTDWTGPTADKVLELYKESLSTIKKLAGQTTVLKDITYGPAERNVLDVYVPAQGLSSGGTRPVLVYFHGGGFFASELDAVSKSCRKEELMVLLVFYRGDKNWSEEVYSNIGYYFASQGIVTILANYQLVPACQYPAPADDVQLVREWVHGHISSEEYGSGDSSQVILVGQSAGGAHVATNLYAAGDPSRLTSSSSSKSSTSRNSIHPPVAGVAYLSVPFYFDHTKARRAQTLREYYGSDQVDDWEARSPVGLFKRLPENSEVLKAFKLPTFICLGQLDPKEIVDANVMFFNAYREKSIPKGTLPAMHVLPGHNHISNVISIGLGENYDIQGPLLLDFIRNVIAS